VRLALVILPVEDLAGAVAFYRAALGLETSVEAPVYVELRDEHGMRLGLYRRDAWVRLVGAPAASVPDGHLAPVELYFLTEDLGAAIDRATAAGARVLSEAQPRDWGDTCAYLEDPSGNVLVLARPTE